MRTLLRRDVGEIADRAHITEIAESYALIETGRGDQLLLWDTPGFGDSARLLKRLRASTNPIGWLLTQVWDRLTDRPFWSSQQAIRNARDESDAILYLVNAAEHPEAVGYVDAEMQILAWMGKPVLLLLNQTGPPRERDRDVDDEKAWQRYAEVHPAVHGVLSLDAFARCWVQEDRLLAMVHDVLAADKQLPFGRLHAAWRERGLDVFEASMRVLASQIAMIAVDRENVAVAQGLRERTGRWIASLAGASDADHDAARAMNALGHRLDAAVRDATNKLIVLHGLSGSAGETILARMSGREFNVARPADEAKSGVIGGVVSGALGGVAADLAAGGITFGAGALIGGILGALGATGAAKAYNRARGATEGKVGWSIEFLAERPAAAVLRYLAVAHYGRGRGDWVESEYPPHWPPVVDAIAARHATEVATVMQAMEAGADRETIAARLHPLLAAITADVLIDLYPEAKPLFASPVPVT